MGGGGKEGKRERDQGEVKFGGVIRKLARRNHDMDKGLVFDLFSRRAEG